MRITIILVFSLFLCFQSSGQEVFYQDICHCGITGAGFSTALGSGSGSFQVHIDPGSIIKKAFLFTQRYGNAKNTSIPINGIVYSFNSSNQISPNLIFPNTPVYSAIHAIDITNDIQSSQNNYNVTIPFPVGNAFGVAYGTVYLYIIYEKPGLPKTTMTILLNNYDMTHYNTEYSIQNLNPINTNLPVGFAIYTDRMNNISGQHDGSKIYVDNNFLGLLKGSDQVNNSWTGAGVKGHFYYQYNQLFGLDDDTPDNVMGGSDGLADISSYLNNNTTSLDWKLIWEKHTNFIYNIYSGFFLTYSTPCDTFSVSVPKDTSICPGVPLQLHASGGTKYEWKSITHPTSTHLSCTNCANPVFSGDSSQVYTVRIWNGDSCSVVRPVRIKVHPRPKNDIFTTDSTLCGTASGKISASIQNLSQLFAISNSGDTLVSNSTSISQLSAGDYTMFYTDTNGCKSLDTVVTLKSYNTTIANFVAQPNKGNVPLQVDIKNESQNATDYSWSLNGVEQGNNFTGFLADTSGSYHIQLIAWQKDSMCSDTARVTVVAFDHFSVQIYNLVSPNKDNKNDTWAIKGITKYPNNEVHIFNRWGNVVFSAQDYQNDWGGRDEKTGKLLPSGTYFYTVKIKYEGKVKKMKGYLELVW